MLLKRYSKSGEKMRILDLGCGKNKYKSENPSDVVIGIDFSEDSDADVIHDLTKFPYPLKDSEFDMIICSHVIEHLPNTLHVLEELWRIAKNGATVKIWTPYFSCPGAYTDVTHIKYFTYNSFNFTKYAPSSSSKIAAKFRNIKRRLLFNKYQKFTGFEWLMNTFPEVYENTFLCYLFPAGIVYFELEVIK